MLPDWNGHILHPVSSDVNNYTNFTAMEIQAPHECRGPDPAPIYLKVFIFVTEFNRCRSRPRIYKYKRFKAKFSLNDYAILSLYK